MILIYATIVLFLLIILIILNYNLHRYAYLHMDRSDDYYIQNYMKKNRVKYDHKVIVSLTTTPTRIHKIKPMIKSILNQSVRIDQIALNIPSEYKGQAYNVPVKLQSMINVFTTGRSYGRGTKCIPTILRETDANTIIILLDDYYIYGYNFIEQLLAEYHKNPDHCLYCKGTILIKSSFVKEDIVDITREDVSDKLLMRYINAPKKQLLTIFDIYPSNFAI